MRVHHLNCGTMRPLGGILVDGQRGLLRAAEYVCHCLLLETGTGLVLVEAGMGSPAARDPRHWLGSRFTTVLRPRQRPQDTAAAQVRALGFDTRDVRHVVLTHLDLDHAGGLVDFPRARVHVYAEELRALRAPCDAAERRRYRSVQFAHGPLWSEHGEAGEPWFGFRAVRELPGVPPEVLLVPLAGHTRGHAGVAVDTGTGWLLHAGDAYFHHGELDSARPHCPPLAAAFQNLMQVQRTHRRDNQARLRALLREHADELGVFSAHSAVELRRLAAQQPARTATAG